MQMELWKSYFVGYIHPTRNFELEEYDHLLKTAGFPSDSVKRRETTMAFGGRDEFHKWLQQLLPHLHYIPKESHVSFIDQIIDTHLRQFPNALQPSGAIHIPLPVLEVEAKKE